MTPTQPTRTIATDPAILPEREADFRTSEGLRVLLHQLHHSGWRDDPQAAALMIYAADKYAPLARKHGLDAWEAASAAFDVMRTFAARYADDPWAVITHAVQITCIYEARAQGLMCSVHQARRPHVSAHHDPERFSDRETPLYEYHPAFHLTDPTGIADDPVESSTDTRVEAMVADAISLFVLLRWPEPTARAGIEHVTTSLARVGTRRGTFEALRRDKHARALLDLPASSWSCLLRVLLSHPDPAYAITTGRGALLRFLLGDTLTTLLADDQLVATIAGAVPGQMNGRGGS